MIDLQRTRSVAGAGILALALAVLATQATTSFSQPGGSSSGGIADVPFAPGERAEFQVKLGGIAVGSGTMEIRGSEQVSGHPTAHARLHVQGGIPLARVNTRMDTWMDTRGLFSRRFEQDQHEVRYKRYRIFDFYPETMTYRQ